MIYAASGLLGRSRKLFMMGHICDCGVWGLLPRNILIRNHYFNDDCCKDWIAKVNGIIEPA